LLDFDMLQILSLVGATGTQDKETINNMFVSKNSIAPLRLFFRRNIY